MLLNKVPILDGSVAVLIIVSLQYFLAYLMKRSAAFEKTVNSTPIILFYNGEFIKEALEKERITEKEILAEVRSYRLERLSDVRAVILEVNGTFSVVKKEMGVSPTSLDDLIN